MFWRTWNDALADFQAGALLYKQGFNWNVLKGVWGEGFITRCSSCEFHFKQSTNRRLKETVFWGDKSANRFRSPSKRMLEAQAEVQFEDAQTELRAFIDEKEKRQPLSSWYVWWVTRKEHIFRAFERKNILESNLAEVVHSALVTQKGTQLSLFA